MVLPNQAQMSPVLLFGLSFVAFHVLSWFGKKKQMYLYTVAADCRGCF